LTTGSVAEDVDSLPLEGFTLGGLDLLGFDSGAFDVEDRGSAGLTGVAADEVGAVLG
jgi:hypothetical protein